MDLVCYKQVEHVRVRQVIHLDLVDLAELVERKYDRHDLESIVREDIVNKVVSNQKK